nr:MAG TPA: hypothetical protein [Caudoviricetes sp.]
MNFLMSRFYGFFKPINSNLAKIETGSLAKIQFVKWDDKTYGLTLFDSAGKGVQLVIERTADIGETNITAYNLKEEKK